MTDGKNKNQTATVEAIQWMHFVAVEAGRKLENLEQAFKGSRGILGKRLPDALADLFGSEDIEEILENELLVFDAEDEYAWINPGQFYFVPASDVTTEYRFGVMQAWKAWVGALVIANQEEGAAWLSLSPGKKNFDMLKNVKSFRDNPSETIFKILELLVRDVPDSDGDSEPEQIEKLVEACRKEDKESARKLEVLAWEMGNARLWRFAMAIADGKTYLARLFEDGISG
jgi:hypothetical protein